VFVQAEVVEESIHSTLGSSSNHARRFISLCLSLSSFSPMLVLPWMTLSAHFSLPSSIVARIPNQTCRAGCCPACEDRHLWYGLKCLRPVLSHDSSKLDRCLHAVVLGVL
jgi:hypothetical protein